MPSPLLADAFGHHIWATLRVLDACEALGRVFTIKSTGSPEPSS